MRLKTQNFRTQASLLIAAGLATALFAAPANAQRSSAPIVYKGADTDSSQHYTAPRQPQYTAQPRRAQAAPANRANARIEFRYPDQPNTIHSESGSYRSQNPAPMAFSSSGAAVSPSTARRYASVQGPERSTRRQSHDPALTTGGFDARATASRISSGGSVDSTPLAPLKPAGQGRAPQSTPARSYSVTPVAGPAMDETGMAVSYGDEFVGQPTANGEIFAQDGMTAAHPSLPLPSLVQVINEQTGAEVVVRVNDRGPFEDGAMLQVSGKAAHVLGFDGAGRANVRVRYLGPAPVQSQILANSYPSAPATQASYDVAYNSPSVPAVQPRAIARRQAPSMSFGDGNYFVQVGSFTDIGNAQALNNALSSGLPVEIEQARVNGADYFRVRVGPMDTRASADALRDHLAEQGIADGRVVSD